MTAVATPPERPPAERRSSGLLRVPFIRRCSLIHDDGRTTTAFIVNINVLGAYVARDDLPLMAAAPKAGGRQRKAPAAETPPASPASSEPMPELGQVVHCKFHLPEQACDVAVDGIVTWINPRQQHPVHSLPPGFGVRFQGLSPDAHACIKELVDEYLARHPQAR
jgi:PilZ domain